MIVEQASKTCPTCDGRGISCLVHGGAISHCDGSCIGPMTCPRDCTDGRVAVPTTERIRDRFEVDHISVARPASWAEFRPADRVLWKVPAGNRWGIITDVGTIISIKVDDYPHGYHPSDSSILTLDLDHESDHRKLHPAWRFPR